MSCIPPTDCATATYTTYIEKQSTADQTESTAKINRKIDPIFYVVWKTVSGSAMSFPEEISASRNEVP